MTPVCAPVWLQHLKRRRQNHPEQRQASYPSFPHLEGPAPCIDFCHLWWLRKVILGMRYPANLIHEWRRPSERTFSPYRARPGSYHFTCYCTFTKEPWKLGFGAGVENSVRNPQFHHHQYLLREVPWRKEMTIKTILSLWSSRPQSDSL